MAGGYSRCVACINATCPSHYPVAQAEARSINAALSDLAHIVPNITWLDPVETLCPYGQCLIMRGVDAIYADDTHLTPQAAGRT